MQGARVQSLIEDLRSCKPCGAAKKGKTKTPKNHRRQVLFPPFHRWGNWGTGEGVKSFPIVSVLGGDETVIWQSPPPSLPRLSPLSTFDPLVMQVSWSPCHRLGNSGPGKVSEVSKVMELVIREFKGWFIGCQNLRIFYSKSTLPVSYMNYLPNNTVLNHVSY